MLEMFLQGVVEATSAGLASAAKQGVDFVRLSRAVHQLNRGRGDKALRVLGERWRLDLLEEDFRGPSLLCHAIAAHRAGRLDESEKSLDYLLAYELPDERLVAEGSLLLVENLAIRRAKPEEAAARLPLAAPAPRLETLRALLEVELGTERIAELGAPAPAPPRGRWRGLRLVPGVHLREKKSFARSRAAYLEGLLQRRRGDVLEARRLMGEALKKARRSIYARWAEEALAELPPETSGPFR